MRLAVFPYANDFTGRERTRRPYREAQILGAQLDAERLRHGGDESDRAGRHWRHGGRELFQIANDKYGAKDKAIRFRHRLAEAVASMAYAGLDPSHLTKQRATHDHQRTPTAERGSTGGER